MRRHIFAAVAAVVVASAGSASAAITEDQVRRAWSEVADAVGMKELPLSIKDERSPNAWVTNGQNVTVTTGLMAILDREAEIFGVLGHEAGHAYLGHHDRTVKNSIGLSLGSAILGRVLGSTVGELAVNVGANLAAAGYSREQEVEADDFATDIAFRSGNDPTGLYNALELIIKFGGRTEPSGFNSHPPDDRRLGRIERRIREIDPTIRIHKILKDSEVPKADAAGVSAKEQEDEDASRKRRIDEEIEKMRRELEKK